MTAQTILPANSVVSGGYEVANSARFNDGDSAYMHKTAAGGNRRTFTFSTWLKRGQLDTNQQLFNCWSANNASGFGYIQFVATESNVIGNRISLEVSGTQILRSQQVLTDPNAWYHLVVAVDTTNDTANNRCRMYLNGTEITSFAARNNPDENFDFAFNQNNIDMYLGSNNYGGTKGNYFDGYLAETVWIDGSQLAADSFGEFDSDSNIWKPIDVSGLTFGDEGFYLDFENSGALGADVSGESNNFTVNNLTAIDQSTDTCTTNYAVLNSLKFSAGTLSNGNLELDSSSASWKNRYSTIGVSSGKWFMEFKMGSISADQSGVAIVSDITLDGNSPGSDATRSPAIQYNSLNIKFVNGTATSSYFSAMSTNDIIGIALDMDNGTVQFYRNGSTTGSAIDLSDAFSTSQYPLFFCGTVYNTRDLQANFGSPSYSESGGETDGNGYGNFANAVPSGYYALNTKNLAEYG